MKITRQQLKNIISEAMYDPMHGIKSLEEPYASKITGVLDNPEVSDADRTQFHHLADTIGDYKDPRPGMPDDSLLGVKAQQEDYMQNARQEIDSYLPGFLNLPKNIIEAVVEFVFLSKDTTLHIQLDEDMVEHEFGEDVHYRGTHFQEIQKPENAKAVAMMNDIRKNPKDHDVKLYYIYAAHGTYDGADPFSRIDPYGSGDSQSGFHDGFREEYQKVTTNSSHKIDSIKVEQAFIRMMRDLRPNHEEQVIN